MHFLNINAGFFLAPGVFLGSAWTTSGEFSPRFRGLLFSGLRVEHAVFALFGVLRGTHHMLKPASSSLVGEGLS